MRNSGALLFPNPPGTNDHLQLLPVSHQRVSQSPIPRETNHHRAYSPSPTNNCIINQRFRNADKRRFEDLVIEDWLQRCVAWLTWVTPRKRPWALGERPDSIHTQVCLQTMEWDAAFLQKRLCRCRWRIIYRIDRSRLEIAGIGDGRGEGKVGRSALW